MTADLVRVKGKNDIGNMLVRLWPYARSHKLRLAQSFMAVLTVAGAGRLAVTLFGYAIDHGLRAKNNELILWVAAGYGLLEVSRCCLIFVQSYLFAKIGNHILFDLRHRLIEHLQDLPIRYFEKNPTGRIVTRVTSDVTGLGELFTQGLISIFSAVVSMLAIMAAMIAVSARLTLITLLVTPPLIWLVVRLNDRLFSVLRESKRKAAALNAFVAENVSGMRVAQLYGRSAKNLERFRSMSADYRDQQIGASRLYALLWPTVSLFNASAVGAALYFGGQAVLAGDISTGTMIAFILHVRAFSDPLNQILEKYQSLQNGLAGAERVFTLLDEPSEHTAPISKSAKLEGSVRFDNVSFRYDMDQPWALRNVSLSVEPGTSVALVGRTGSGKSTLISLLQRFYDPTEGRITLDGRSILSFERHGLRSRLGVVQQDTFIFQGSVADNIGMLDPTVARARIESAARMACLDQVLERRGHGLDTHVEERGANLSAGERQLIAFARVLAFDPDILILDEATANIDSHTESLIQEATRRIRRGRTSFIVAHRISTVLDCDLIVQLDGGRIVST